MIGFKDCKNHSVVYWFPVDCSQTIQMVDRDVIIAKAASVRFHLDRIAAKTNRGLDDFLCDVDRQDIVASNLHMAVESCIDIAAHIISENGWGVPGGASEMF